MTAAAPRTAPLLLLAALLAPSAVHAAAPPALSAPAQGFGVGLVAGDPSGLSVAYRPPSSPAYLQAAAGWSFGDETLSLNGDWLWTFTELSIPDEPDHLFPIYAGIGGRLRLGRDSALKESGRSNSVGIRFPVGISYNPQVFSADVYVELAPTLVLLPETKVALGGAIGIRLYPFRKAIQIRM